MGNSVLGARLWPTWLPTAEFSADSASNAFCNQLQNSHGGFGENCPVANLRPIAGRVLIRGALAVPPPSLRSWLSATGLHSANCSVRPSVHLYQDTITTR